MMAICLKAGQEDPAVGRMPICPKAGTMDPAVVMMQICLKAGRKEALGNCLYNRENSEMNPVRSIIKIFLRAGKSNPASKPKFLKLIPQLARYNTR